MTKHARSPHSAASSYLRVPSYGLGGDHRFDEKDNWLTPEYREHFESIGEDLVMRDVFAHNYSEAEKHFAAIDWLRQKREAREALQRRALNIGAATLIVALLTLVFTLVGLLQSS